MASTQPIFFALCTANACRSQMAEALDHYKWPQLQCYSAGVKPGVQVDPNALIVLKEIGINHSNAYNKTIEQAESLFQKQKVALVLTVCDNAAGECPVYLRSKNYIHHPFRDPPKIAKEHPNDDPLIYYREIRDEISAFIDTLPDHIPALKGCSPVPLVISSSDNNSESTKLQLEDMVCHKVEVAMEIMKDLNNSSSNSSPSSPSSSSSSPSTSKISFFEKYLTIWVLLCMIIGSLIGYYVPSVVDALAQAQFYSINAIVAVLLWLMMFPMMVQIDFAAILRVRENPGAIGLTSTVNYLIQPFTMYGIALLFFRSIYTTVIPDEDLRNSYIAGLILLGAAPCTAMVFVWSLLTNGDGAYTLVQVAFNDLLMLGLYVPICGGLIGASNIALPWDLIAIAVAIFIVAPLVLAATVRNIVLHVRNEQFLQEKIIAPFKPVTIIALLLTLILIFIFQGKTIAEKPLHIVLLVVPISLQTCLIFVLTYVLGYLGCIDHQRLAPAALISTSNFFELAVAVAISLYGLDSGAALATVVGVLVEVPLMLALVWVCNKLQPKLEERIKQCDKICPWSKELTQKLANACGGNVNGNSNCCGSKNRSTTVGMV